MESTELESDRFFFGHLTKVVVLRVLFPVCLCRGGGIFKMKEHNPEQIVGINLVLIWLKVERKNKKTENDF